MVRTKNQIKKKLKEFENAEEEPYNEGVIDALKWALQKLFNFVPEREETNEC